MPDLRGPDLARRLVIDTTRVDHALHVRLHGRRAGRRDQLAPGSRRLHPETFLAQCARRQGARDAGSPAQHRARSTHDTSRRPLPRARPGVERAHRHPHDRQSRRPRSPSLVSTWTLTTFEQGVSGGQPARVTNPRGLLVLDAAGHAFEFVTSLASQRTTGGQVPVAEALAAFAGYGGFWGQYRVDAAQQDDHVSRRRRASARRSWREGVLAIDSSSMATA